MPDTAAVEATEATEAPTLPVAPVEASRWAAPTAEAVGVSAAEFITAAANPATPRAVMARYLEAATNNTTSDEIPGIIPESIVGQVITMSNDKAPLYTALGPKAAPPGKSFTLPILTTDLTDAAAAAELADVSGELGVDPATVTMAFIKRSVPLSQEAIIYSQPGITQIALDRLNAAISRGAEANAVATLEGVVGGNAPFAVAADGSDFFDQLLAAAYVMEAACGEYPTHIVMAPDVVTALRGFKVSDGWNTPLIDTWRVSARGSITGDVDGLIPVRSRKLTEGYAALVSDVGVSSWRGPDARMTLADPNTMTYSIGGGVSVGLGVADPTFTTAFTVSAPA